MKKYILASLFIFSAVLTQAQRMNPVNWSFQAVKKADKQYDIVLTANVEAPWHIYSQFVKKGPIPTTIEFKTNPLVQIKGAAKELGKLEKSFDKNFDAEISYFSGKVQFCAIGNTKSSFQNKIVGDDRLYGL